MRLRVIRIVYFSLLVLIVLRLYYWQIIRSDELAARAEEQHLESVQVQAPRGEIRFRDGEIVVANRPSYLLFANPRVIEDKLGASEQLTKILALSAKEDKQSEKFLPEQFNLLREKLSQDKVWVPLAKDLSVETKLSIEQLSINGVGFEESSARFYPEASMSAHLLGFVGSDSVGRSLGYFGIEGYYNRQLQGSQGMILQERDAKGLPILSGKFFQKEPVRGADLTLSIDRTVQYLVEKQLKKGLEKHGARSASAVVMDVKSGEILAMASYPSYDPGSFGSFPKEYYKNPVVAETYEPGSTFKVLIMSAALNERVVEPETKCDSCLGPVEISGHLIRTWNNKYRPDLTMTETIIHSDNTGMVFAGKRLGLDKLYHYLESFGIGSKTGIDLQDEISPEIREKSTWREINLATASFGQGIAVTPIQILRAVGALANGGRLMEPHLITKISFGEKTTSIQPRVVATPLSQDAADQIKEMMVQAVDKGEAQFYKKKAGLEGYKIAGKTGTAQIPVAGHYDPNKTVASFVGFAPAGDPKFVMLVKYNEPTSSIFGADTAAPTFFEIAKELFLYYNISPSE